MLRDADHELVNHCWCYRRWTWWLFSTIVVIVCGVGLQKIDLSPKIYVYVCMYICANYSHEKMDLVCQVVYSLSPSRWSDWLILIVIQASVRCVGCLTYQTFKKPCFQEGELSKILPDDFHGSAHLHVSAVLYVQVDAGFCSVNNVQFCFVVATHTLLLRDQCIIGFESLPDLIECEGR